MLKLFTSLFRGWRKPAPTESTTAPMPSASPTDTPSPVAATLPPWIEDYQSKVFQKLSQKNIWQLRKIARRAKKVVARFNTIKSAKQAAQFSDNVLQADCTLDAVAAVLKIRRIGWDRLLKS